MPNNTKYLNMENPNMVLLFKHPLNNMKETCPGLTFLHENNRFYFCFKHRLNILQYIIQHFLTNNYLNAISIFSSIFFVYSKSLEKSYRFLAHENN